MKRILSLPHLPAFDAAARLQSFSAAAEELCLTTGAVSRHIRTLETRLGAVLFTRGHRTVQLTPAGEEFARVVRRLLVELEAAEQAAIKSSSQSSLSILCLPTFAMHWLMPRLAAFNEIYPDIAVDITTSMGVVNKATAFDVAIRRDERHFAGLRAEAFMQEESVLVCSPSYLQRYKLKSPDNLSGHTIIHIRARDDLWEKWYRHFNCQPNKQTSSVTLDHAFAAIQAAEDGLGVAVVPLLFCARHLENGRLVAPFPDQRIHSGTYSLLLRNTESEAARQFQAWLQQAAGQGD